MALSRGEKAGLWIWALVVWAILSWVFQDLLWFRPLIREYF